MSTKDQHVINRKTVTGIKESGKNIIKQYINRTTCELFTKLLLPY